MKVSSVWNVSGTAWESETHFHKVQTTRHAKWVSDSAPSDEV